MNTVLWILQIVLALHTLIGAAWKFATPVDAMPSLKALAPVWRPLVVVEIGLALLLSLPVIDGTLQWLAALGAFGVAAEMVVFSVVHVRSGDKTRGPLAYWLVVAAIAVAIGVGRLAVATPAG